MSKRRTGIELLRIILFFEVVTIHVATRYFSFHNDPAKLNWLVSDVFVSFSRAAVNCFVIITGYFAAGLGFSGHFVKLKKLLVAMGGYLGFYFAYFLIKNREKGLVDDFLYSVKVLVTDFFGLGTYFYHMWYFMVLTVLLLVAGFINAGAKALTKKEASMFCLVLFVLVSVIPTVHYVLGVMFLPFQRYMCDLALFITLYLFGVNIKLHGFGQGFSRLKCFAAAFGALALIAVLTYLYNSPLSPYIHLSFIRGFAVSYPFESFIGIFFANENILDVLGAVFLFLLFLQIDIKGKALGGVVCFVSKATFGGYILHALFIYALDDVPAINVFAHFNGTFYVLYLVAYVGIVGLLSLLPPMIISAVKTSLRRRKSVGASSG